MRKRRGRWWQIGPRKVLAVALLIAIFTMSARETSDPDLWWHLATGRYIVETRSIPHHDVFSYTVAGRPWVTHEWLTDVVMFLLYRLGGLTALLVAACVVITATFALVYLNCEARPHLAVFAVLLSALASAVTWGPRPQMLNALMAALFFLLLRRYREGARLMPWLFPPLIALWVNLHSGFFLGLTILALFIAGELASNLLNHRAAHTLSYAQLRLSGIVLALCVVAALLNPNTCKMLWYPFETLGSKAMQQYIQEWASPDFHRKEFWPFAALLLGGAGTIAFSRRRRDLTGLMFFFGLGLAGLVSARHIPLFAVVAAPTLSRYAAQVRIGRLRWDLRQLPPPRSPTTPMVVVNWTLIVAFALASGGWVIKGAVDNLDIEVRRYPVTALEYIDAHGLADGRMYNSYNWGGYLLWRGYPVFIDGRADVYMDEFINYYLLAYRVRADWRRPLDEYNVDYVLIESDASLATLLEADVGWKRVYRDDIAVIFCRRDAESNAPSPIFVATMQNQDIDRQAVSPLYAGAPRLNRPYEVKNPLRGLDFGPGVRVRVEPETVIHWW